VISTGKEANIYHAFGCKQEQREREIAIKVYRISTSNFRAMQSYLIGDPRFKNVRHEKRSIVFAWTKKELRNLKKAHAAGVRVPEPFVERNNVLLMEFIGEDEIPAPQLREVSLTPREARKAFETTVEYVRILYHANLAQCHPFLQEEGCADRGGFCRGCGTRRVSWLALRTFGVGRLVP
jgi:RIO kinase 1